MTHGAGARQLAAKNNGTAPLREPETHGSINESAADGRRTGAFTGRPPSEGADGWTSSDMADMKSVTAGKLASNVQKKLNRAQEKVRPP